MALTMMLKTLYRTSIFGCFELRFSPLSTFSFRKKTSSPLRKRGKPEFIHFTYDRRISEVSILLAY
jgi:hypothetical protein